MSPCEGDTNTAEQESSCPLINCLIKQTTPISSTQTIWNLHALKSAHLRLRYQIFSGFLLCSRIFIFSLKIENSDDYISAKRV